MTFSNSPAIHSMKIDILCNSNNDNEDLQERINPIQRINDSSEIPAIRFLGVFFDQNLNFKHHISLISEKLSRALYILRSVKNTLSTEYLTSLYYTIFHSHLIYAIPIWSSTLSSNFDNIYKLQKAAIRIINGEKYNAHTEPLFISSKILPLPDLCNYFKIQFLHRFTQKFLPISFNDTWVRNDIRNVGENEILLRNSTAIQIPFSRLASSDRQPLIAFPRLWEQFPDIRIKFIRKISEFDEKLKTFYLNDLSSTSNCNRLYCYSCSRNNT